MSIGEVTGIIALVVSALNVCCYVRLQGKYNDLAKQQTLASVGGLETQLRCAIDTAKSELHRCTASLAVDYQDEILQKCYYSAEESYRNAYEDACAKYLDGKVDKRRFKRIYKREIHNLVTDRDQRQYYPDKNSQYSATMAVYREWFQKGSLGQNR